MPLFLTLCRFLASICILSCCAAMDTIAPGQALVGSERLISSNGKFALGFFQTGSKSPQNTLNWYLGIWFNRVPKLTQVWVANGDNPLRDHTSSELTISNNGNLVILNQATNSTVWSTQANTTTNNTVAILLNNGNLILQNSNSSDVLWQSFDYPTDTLLPGAKLGWDKAYDLNRRLVSRKNLIDLAPGRYSEELDPSGANQYIITLLNSSLPYWFGGIWNGKYFALVPEMAGPQLYNLTFVGNDQQKYFTYNILDETTVVRHVMDVSGQVKTFIWLESSQDWLIYYAQPTARCDVYAGCGPFTVCNDNELPHCNCMKGFLIRSPRDWELGDQTDGCMRNIPLNCVDGNSTGSSIDKFYSIQCVTLPHNAYNIEAATNEGKCETVCLSNCSCTAYSYGNGGCFVWYSELLNVKQQQCNGTSDINGGTLYVRLAAKEEQSRKNNTRGGMMIAISLGVSSAIMFPLALALVIWWNKKRRCNFALNNAQGGNGIIPFSYTDLQRATKSFAEKLGEGGFGSVFKGFLSNSTIAVKRLDRVHQGEKQFRAEISSLGLIQHINLIKLIGFCCSGNKKYLVYEYMPNHSLDKHLFPGNANILNWDTRYQIALGVARGLAYLHESCRDCIIHCDVKPENILLDESFIPKIADFGMAKFLHRDFSRALTTMRGTIGYLAPEWISGVAITPKVDVYSYGMLLFEIISGRRNSHRELTTVGDDYTYFPVQVAHNLLIGDAESMVDHKLHGNFNLKEAERACKIACWCVQDNEADRPMMGEVVQILEGLKEVGLPPVPKLLQAIAEDSLSV